jgi:hypothetical protein
MDASLSFSNPMAIMRVNRNLYLKRGTDSLLFEFELLYQLLDAQTLLLQPMLLLPKSRSHWMQKISTRKGFRKRAARDCAPLSASRVFLSSLACSASMAA